MVTLARDFYVFMSSGTTNIPAIFVFALHIAKACDLRTFFKLWADHSTLHAFNFHCVLVFQLQFSDWITGVVTPSGCGSVCISTLTSTRRFNSRPCESVFGASGWVEP